MVEPKVETMVLRKAYLKVVRTVEKTAVRLAVKKADGKVWKKVELWVSTSVEMTGGKLDEMKVVSMVARTVDAMVVLMVGLKVFPMVLKLVDMSAAMLVVM